MPSEVMGFPCLGGSVALVAMYPLSFYTARARESWLYLGLSWGCGEPGQLRGSSRAGSDS